MNPYLILMMMVTVIYAASHVQPNMLEEIFEEAKHVRKNLSKDEKKIQVPAASEPAKKCVDGFFCRAEKSLKKTNLHALSRLKHYLNQYNKCHNHTCVVNNTRVYSLDTLLKEIEECTGFFLPTKCVRKQRMTSNI